MNSSKPPGVGINKIPVRKMIEFGIAKGRIDPDDMWEGVPGPITIGALLPDWAIREFVTIDGFVDYDDCPKDVVSYGLTSSGYDVRVGGIFKVFTNVNCETVSPRSIKPDAFSHRDLTGHDWDAESGLRHSRGWSTCRGCGLLSADPGARLLCRNALADTARSIKIPPNSFALAETVEVLYIPRNINCLCLGKSTYARCGINMNFTPFEPGWFGVVTVEIANLTPLPVEIFAWQGIGQAQFTLTVGSPQRSYAEKKNAKYQGQTGLTLPSVK